MGGVLGWLIQLSFDSISCHDLSVLRSSPTLGSVLSMESAWASLPLPLPPLSTLLLYPPLTLSILKNYGYSKNNTDRKVYSESVQNSGYLWGQELSERRRKGICCHYRNILSLRVFVLQYAHRIVCVRFIHFTVCKF